MKKLFLISVLALSAAISAKADGTNLQIFYDFGGDRKIATTTLEGFYNDNWGNTFFFIDHDYPTRSNADGSRAQSGTYWELARCLNFWKNSAVKDLSLQVEYNGGAYRAYPINHAFLFGVDYFVHNADFRYCFNFKLLYKHILYDKGAFLTEQEIKLGRSYHMTNVPLQFTFVWGMQDIFKCKGLRFCGFLDVWGEEHEVHPTNMGTGETDWTNTKLSHVVFMTEPQLWYCVGQHFNCNHLNVGAELELTYDFGSSQGFKCRPCLGVKWDF